jgi:hypothetical protein
MGRLHPKRPRSSYIEITEIIKIYDSARPLSYITLLFKNSFQNPYREIVWVRGGNSTEIQFLYNGHLHFMEIVSENCKWI